MHRWVSPLSYTRILKTFAFNLVLTHSLNFFIVTKRISYWHHFCKWEFLLELCNWHFLWRLCRWQFLLHLFRFWGSTFCYWYVGGSFCYNYAGECVCCNYVVRNFCSTLSDDSFCCKYVGGNFYCNYVDGSLCCNYTGGIFAVHYAHNFFYCNYTSDSFFYSFKKKNFMVPFYGWGSTASRLEPLPGGSLLFTTKFPETSGTHFTNLPRKDERLSLPWNHQWFWTWDLWIRNQVPWPLG